ncbi:MAG: hypothetical protein GY820_38490 [Gammaproteobacteria bacterium]|nr:hypothetical protein [Gammaproteobacteria bacterium]
MNDKKNTEIAEIKDDEAVSVDAIVRRMNEKAPGYKLQFNELEIDINGKAGMWEIIGTDNKVHYRRAYLNQINDLIEA